MLEASHLEWARSSSKPAQRNDSNCCGTSGETLGDGFQAAAPAGDPFYPSEPALNGLKTMTLAEAEWQALDRGCALASLRAARPVQGQFHLPPAATSHFKGPTGVQPQRTGTRCRA